MDELDPQLIQAQLLRRAQQAKALQEANAQAGQFDTLAAIAQMANNPGAAAAAKMAQSSAQARHKPLSLGQQGFALPASGEFVESPMYVDEQNNQRLFRLATSAQTDATRQAAIDAQNQRDRNNRESRERENQRDRLFKQWAIGVTEAGKDGRSGGGDDKKKNANITKYSTTLDKAGVPEFDSALTVVEGNLTKYKPGELPGYGRALSYVPGSLLNNEHQGVRADMAQAANILLKVRSGAAVTDGEMRRFLQEVATGGGMDEATLRRGWANVRKAFDAKRQNLTQMLSPEEHDEYVGRGGTDFRIQSKSKAGSDALTPEEARELAELKKRLGKK